MNASFDMYRSVSSKTHKRDEVTHPVSAKLFGHSNSTFRGRESATFNSPSRRSHPPLSVPATGSYRLSRCALKDVPNSSALVSFKFTNRQATELKDIRLFKNLVKTRNENVDRPGREREPAAPACGRAAFAIIPPQTQSCLQRPGRPLAPPFPARNAGPVPKQDYLSQRLVRRPSQSEDSRCVVQQDTQLCRDQRTRPAPSLQRF